MSFLRRDLPTLLVSFFIIIAIAQFFINIPAFDQFANELQNWAVIVTAMGFGTGIINLMRVHIPVVTNRVKGRWPFSLWLLVFMIITLIVGLVGTQSHPAYTWIYNNIYDPIAASLISLVGFYTVAMAWRALRGRNWDAIVFVVTYVIILFAMSPAVKVIFPPFMPFSNWVATVPATGAGRGKSLCVSIGIIMLAIRTIIGREKTLIGIVEESE
jgi:hypothetical protein